MLNPPTFDRWAWTDLLGFDNRASDFGVGDFIRRAGFTPPVISLLIADPEFIHAHDGSRDQALAPTLCSYCGHPANELHARQDWTSFELRGLVGSLHQQGVKVLVANFDSHFRPGCGDWLDRHPEVHHISKTHGRMNSLCPWKHLADGTLYEDFFCRKLMEVLDDYGLDGYHGADGYAHPRIPIYDGDFSDDMVAQFIKAMDAGDPAELRQSCDGDQEQIIRRAQLIWSQYRKQWIGFYTRRQLSFWKKITQAVHARSKMVVLNSAWTRDPFEAIYRYGMDYRKVAEIGVDGLVVEAAAAALETLEGGEESSRYLCNFTAALMLIKAYAPSLPLRWLNGVKDNLEQWSALRHTPTVLESEIYALANVFAVEPGGLLRRCADGVVVCLADGLADYEWRWLNDKWRLATSLEPSAILGATLVWSDAALHNQINAFIATGRQWTTHRVLHHLLSCGAAVAAVARIEDLSSVRGPILVIHPEYFPPEQRRRIDAYDEGEVLSIGGAGATFVMPPDSPSEDVAGDEPFSWVNELPFRSLPLDFIQHCADAINSTAHQLKILSHGNSIRLLAMRKSDCELRLLIRNDEFLYLTPEIDASQPIERVQVLSGFITTAIEPRGSRFSVKVPLRGMAVVDLKLGVI